MEGNNNSFYINIFNNIIHLTKEELSCLYTFTIAIFKMNLLSSYNLFDKNSTIISIYKDNNLWQVYDNISGNISVYENCYGACIKAINLISNDINNKELMLGIFFKFLNIKFNDLELEEFLKFLSNLDKEEKMDYSKKYRRKVLSLYKDEKISSNGYFIYNYD